MEKLEKVELVREKTGVSYQDARDALEACDYDVLDAIIWLEGKGKADTTTATYETSSTTTQTTSFEMREAQEEYQRTSKKTRVGEAWGSFCREAKRILRASLEMTFVAEHKGDRVIALPLLLLIIGLFAWGASLWLLIVGLFFGLRYHIEGISSVTIDVNDAMDKAADAAESIKNDFTNRDE